MTDRVLFKSSRYALRRIDGVVGDSGGLLVSRDPVTGETVGDFGEIIVGCRVQCGSSAARSFSHQDWWMTSAIKTIIESEDGLALVGTESGNLYYVGEDAKVERAVRLHNTVIK